MVGKAIGILVGASCLWHAAGTVAGNGTEGTAAGNRTDDVDTVVGVCPGLEPCIHVKVKSLVGCHPTGEAWYQVCLFKKAGPQCGGSSHVDFCMTEEYSCANRTALVVNDTWCQVGRAGSTLTFHAEGGDFLQSCEEEKFAAREADIEYLYHGKRAQLTCAAIDGRTAALPGDARCSARRGSKKCGFRVMIPAAEAHVGAPTSRFVMADQLNHVAVFAKVASTPAAPETAPMSQDPGAEPALASAVFMADPSVHVVGHAEVITPMAQGWKIPALGLTLAAAAGALVVAAAAARYSPCHRAAPPAEIDRLVTESGLEC